MVSNWKCNVFFSEKDSTRKNEYNSRRHKQDTYFHFFLRFMIFFLSSHQVTLFKVHASKLAALNDKLIGIKVGDFK